MKKNSRLHLLIETPLKKRLIEEAEEKGVSLGQLCRSKLKKKPQLDRIEEKLDKVLKNKERII